MTEPDVRCPDCGDNDLSVQYETNGTGWAVVSEWGLSDKGVPRVVTEGRRETESYDIEWSRTGYIYCAVCSNEYQLKDLVIHSDEVEDGEEPRPQPGPGQLRMEA